MQASLLKDLDKKHTNWIIKVRVARKYIVPVNNDVKIARSLELVLIDSEGDRIQATIMPPYISKFEGKLNEEMIIYLTNFTVKDNNSKYRATTNVHRLFFMPITEVICVGDKKFPSSIYNFKSIAEIEGFENVDDAGLFDFVGKVVAKHALQHQKLTASNTASRHIDIVLQDLETKRITVTLWGEYADEINNYIDTSNKEHVIMIIQMCRAKKFQGHVGLCNTYYATKLLINSCVPEIEDFKNKLCFDNNSQTETIAHLSSSPISTVEEEFDSGKYEVMTLEQLLNIKKTGFCWVVCRISAVVSDGYWSYISCKRCRKKLCDSPRGYFCEPCNLRSNNAIPRYRVKVNVVDGILDLTFILWDEACEILIGKTALEIRERIAKELAETGQTTTTKLSEYSVTRAGRPEDLEILVGRVLLFKVNVKNQNVEENDPVFSVSRISDDKQLIEKYKKSELDVTKKSDLLSWIAKSGEEVIELDDSVSENEDENPIMSRTKRARVGLIDDTANSCYISDGGSSSMLSSCINTDKPIKVEKE